MTTDPSRPDLVVLIGLMGSGKTTVGRLLARRLGWRYWDNDAELVRRDGRPLADLVALGTEELHRRERRVLLAGLAAPRPLVLSAPGSVVPVDDELTDLLGSAFVVWLRARTATLVSRVRRGGQHRPLGGDPAAKLQRLADARSESYAALATLVVDVDEMDPSDVVDLILAALPG